MILLIDNYDSFVFNLARYFERLGQETHVVRNDAIDADGIAQLQPDALILSPGPCTPNEAGCSLEIVRQLYTQIPILGVCLGHQVIGQAFGGSVVRASQPMHGRTSQMFHRGENIFHNLPIPFTATRYHSLIVSRVALPDSLYVTAWTADDSIMGLAHRSYSVFGVQFHPESVLSDSGYALLANFLRIADISVRERPPDMATERPEPTNPEQGIPTQVITF